MIEQITHVIESCTLQRIEYPDRQIQILDRNRPHGRFITLNKSGDPAAVFFQVGDQLCLAALTDLAVRIDMIEKPH